MLKVGITGGIGSGKTTVCKIFEMLGIPVYYADDRAKWLMVNDQNLIDKLKMAFGEGVYYENGELNRNYLANLVFNNKSKLEQLNGIVHPAVGHDGERWHNAQKKVPFTIKEAALFYENGSHALMDKMITVVAPEELRIARVVKRDKTTPDAVKARMNKQLSQEYKAEQADYVIDNSGKNSLIRQVWTIFKDLKDISSTRLDNSFIDEQE